MVDREMLSAISDLLDKKLDEKLDAKFDEKLGPINDRFDRIEADVEELKQTTSKLTDDMRYVKVVLLENNVIPRLNTIESCYVETSKRYLERAEQIDTMQEDIDTLKSTVEKHSEIIQKIS